MSYLFRIVLPIALLVVPLQAPAQDAIAARKAIQSRYEFLNKSFVSKNIADVGKVFSPECVVSVVGEPTKLKTPQYLILLGKSFTAITVQNTSTRIDSIKRSNGPIKGWEVSATSKSEYTFQAPTDGKTKSPIRKLKRSQTVTDVWSKTKDGWQIRGRKVGSDG